jgi:hypothetical protein
MIELIIEPTIESLPCWLIPVEEEPLLKTNKANTVARKVSMIGEHLGRGLIQPWPGAQSTDHTSEAATHC